MILKCSAAEKPARIEIHGDYIAVLIRWRISERARYCFFLVDWKRGKILLVSGSGAMEF
jgi:hypothetical protein